MTKTILVTGGTGFLGEQIVRELLARGGYHVRVLALTRSPILAELDVEMVRANLLSGAELDSALDGCQEVLHLAGMVSRDPDDGQRMMRIHVDGTRRLYEHAARAGVRRVVISSTSGTIGVSKTAEVLDETAGYATELVGGWAYYTSKIYQEKLAFKLGEKLGIETVAVNPSLLLGPGDRRLSSTRDVLRFLRRQIPFVPGGGVSFVDVRDTAAATVTALDKGRSGECYLMGGPNWTCKEFFGRLSRVAKLPGPRFTLPGRVSRFGANVIEHVYRNRGKEPPVDSVSAEMSEHYWWIDSSKAERELGFESRDPALTLGDTIRYLRKGVAADL